MKGRAMQEATFETADGLTIFYRSWRPAGPPRATVVLNHGFNAHSGQYLWSADQLTTAGYAVHALDMRGRGKSAGRRFTVDDIGRHVGDLHQMVGIAKAADPGLKLFLLGHSAGGVVACTYTLEHQQELAGFICEDFAFEVPAPALLLTLVKLLAHPFPNLPILKLKNEFFSRDPAAVAALNADPLIANETQPAVTVAALARADERLRVSFPSITLPLLILHGTADKATRYQGSQFFYDHAGSGDKTLKLYEGYYHDLLNDIGKERPMSDIIAWIDAHLG
jgi:alpha-beta hydrolase superfamily lysophospholipase